MKKGPTKNQLAFSFDEPVKPAHQPSMRDAYIEQIKRDMQALRQEPPGPWRDFFEQRIESFRQGVKELDEQVSRGENHG